MDYDKVESHFDGLVKDYRDITTQQHAFFDKDTSYLQEYKVSIAKELVTNPASILDYGCGIGLLQDFLSSYFPHAQIIATDISTKSLEFVRQNYPETTSVNHDEALLSNYDLILVSCVLHHVPPFDRLALLERLSQALTPRGCLLIFEHNPLNPVTQHLVNTCPVDDDAILLRRSQLVRLLSSIKSARVAETGYTLFFPGSLRKLRRWEKHLRWLPMGGQYFVLARRV